MSSKDSDLSKAELLAAVGADMEAIASELPLANSGRDIVPGEGSSSAKIMFIGEAPGEEEARQRRPFVGRSGQLFRQVLTKVGYSPTEVYISNIVKVRPPGNRDPMPDEITAFKPFLDREIAILEPDLIVTLGRYSMGKFLPGVKISQVHGRLHKVAWNDKTMFVLPMYHPAAALRAPNVKQAFEADFQKLPKVLGWVQDQHAVAELKAEVSEALL